MDICLTCTECVLLDTVAGNDDQFGLKYVHCRPNLSNIIPLKIISVVNFDLLQFKRDRLQLQLRNSKLLLTI